MPKSYSVGIVGESNYQTAIRGLREGERVFLQPEPDNPHDPRAIAVRDGEGQTIGYIPRDSWLSGAIIDEGKGSRALVERIEGGDAGRPSLGVVLAVELGEKGAPTGAASSSSVAGPGKQGGSKQVVGCAVVAIVALLALPSMCSSDEPKADSAPSTAVDNAALAAERTSCETTLAGLTDTGLIREREREGDRVIVEDANWAGLPYRDKVNVLRAVVCARTGKFEPEGSEKASAYAYRSGDRLLTLTASGAF